MDIKSIGKEFCDIHLLIENNRWGYIIIKAGNKVLDYEGSENLVNKDDLKIHEIDGIPHVVLSVRPRFIKGILKVFDNPSRIFSSLRTYFSVNDIHKFFYKLWVCENNRITKKNNIREINEINRLKKLGKYKVQDKTITYLTQKMGIKNASREYGII